MHFLFQRTLSGILPPFEERTLRPSNSTQAVDWEPFMYLDVPHLQSVQTTTTAPPPLDLDLYSGVTTPADVAHAGLTPDQMHRVMVFHIPPYCDIQSLTTLYTPPLRNPSMMDLQ